ncbi:MAG: amidohydrolase [Candidatus Cloacimonetes bacterium]|nr:amidohydrolase [Candidatus Cloacimonadota bacterium]
MINLIKVRQELHQIPELAFQEFKTQEYILNKLMSYPGLQIHRFAPTGLLVEYTGSQDKYELFRADMDALPITENTGCDFSSIHPGKMHACGHDIHITILLGLIDQVMQHKPRCNLLFLFQPAEEGCSGAEAVLADLVWQKYEIENAYALHVSPDLPVGTISSRAGNFFAATAEYDVTIEGVSSHIATPEKGRNALQAGIEVYQSVQQLPHIVKSDEHFLCDFGILTAGSVRNAIPAHCLLSGTIRAADRKRIAALKESFKAICQAVSAAYDVKIDTEFLAEYQEVYNSAELLENLKTAAAQTNVNYRQAEMTMAGEDFGFIAARWKGLLFWLGASDKKSYPLHSDRFLPAEEAIEIGVKLFYQLILNKLGT